jgi:hypothetical protein
LAAALLDCEESQESLNKERFMWARIAGGLLILAASSANAIADDDIPSFESPDAVRRLLDKAVPELLDGHDRAAELFGMVGGEKTARIPRQLQAKRDEDPEDLGVPLGWNYLGERRLGDAICQYVYVCRYSNSPLVLRFVTMKRNGRWLMLQDSANCDALALVAEASSDRSSKPGDYLGLCDKLVDQIVHGDSEVVQTVKASSLRKGKEPFSRAVLQIPGAVAMLGGVSSCERVEAKNVGGVFAQCSYVVQCQTRNGLFLRFTFYRPDKEWKLAGLSMQSFNKMDDLLAGAALEPAQNLGQASHADGVKAR